MTFEQTKKIAFQDGVVENLENLEFYDTEKHLIFQEPRETEPCELMPYFKKNYVIKLLYKFISTCLISKEI